MHASHCGAVRGEIVYRLGEAPDGLRGVVSGGFAFEIAPHERGPNFAHLFRPGFWFGEAEMFDGRPKIATIAATRESVYLHLSRSQLSELIAEDLETWRWLGLLGGRHLEIALGIIDDSTLRHPGHRITAILLRLASVRLADIADDPQPELDLTQSDIAHLATLSRATVAEHLDKLEREGLVSRAYRRLTILDPAGMRERLMTCAPAFAGGHYYPAAGSQSAGASGRLDAAMARSPRAKR